MREKLCLFSGTVFMKIALCCILLQLLGQSAIAGESAALDSRAEKAIESSDTYMEGIAEQHRTNSDQEKIIVELSKEYLREAIAKLVLVQKQFMAYEESDIFVFAQLSTTADVNKWKKIPEDYKLASSDCKHFISNSEMWFKSRFEKEKIDSFQKFWKGFRDREMERRKKGAALPGDICVAHEAYSHDVLQLINLLYEKRDQWYIESGDLEPADDDFLDSYNDLVEKLQISQEKLNILLTKMS